MRVQLLFKKHLEPALKEFEGKGKGKPKDINDSVSKRPDAAKGRKLVRPYLEPSREAHKSVPRPPRAQNPNPNYKATD